jgi:isoquinoline 1-oxidoreductase beta subunit
VHRVVCAVDCGVAVNPDVIRAQVEGATGFALGALYHGEIEIKAGRAVRRNFDTYKALRIHEMPRIEVHISGVCLWRAPAWWRADRCTRNP